MLDTLFRRALGVEMAAYRAYVWMRIPRALALVALSEAVADASFFILLERGSGGGGAAALPLKL
jgi:hypothetical protein